MTGETMAVIGMGLAIIGLNWRMYTALRADNAALRRDLDAKIGALQADVSGVKERLAALEVDVKERLTAVETTLGLLIKGLHIEVSAEAADTNPGREKPVHQLNRLRSHPFLRNSINHLFAIVYAYPGGQGTSGLKRLCKVLACALLVTAALASDTGAPRAQDDKTAEEVFHNHISGPVVQAKCVNCHVANGMSGNTRLVFVRSSDTLDHEARNLRTLQNLLDDLADEAAAPTS